MKYRTKVGLLAVAVAFTAACAYQAPVIPPSGILFTNIKAPLTTDFQDTPVGAKQGNASCYYFYDFLLTGMGFAWDEAALREAAADGNLTVVEYADYEYLSILGVFRKFTVTAYGR